MLGRNLHFVIIVSFLVVSLFIPVTCDVNSKEEGILTNLIRTSDSYVLHNPIVISNVTDLVNQGWPGLGTEEDPFVISGLNITSSDTCIQIENVDVFLEIDSCHLKSTDSVGISLVNVVNCTISSCEISECDTGIFIYSSSYCKVTNTTLMESVTGVKLAFSNNCIIQDSIVANGETGISCDIGINCEIENCTIAFNDLSGVRCIFSYLIRINNSILFDNQNGLYSSSTSGISINNCDFERNQETAIKFYETYSCIITNCTLTENGIQLGGSEVNSYAHIIDNVTVNGKPLGYFHDESEMTLDGQSFGQIIITECNDVNIQNGNFSFCSIGLTLVYSEFCTIEGILLEHNEIHGFWIYNSQDCQIFSAEEHHNGAQSLVEDSSYIMILNHYVRDQLYGIDVRRCTSIDIIDGDYQVSSQGVRFTESFGCSFQSNIVSGAAIGVYIWNSEDIYHNSNTIYACSTAGVYSSTSLSQIFTENEIMECLGDGIFCYDQADSIFVDNSIHNNQGTGIYLNDGSRGNELYGNVLFQNILGNVVDDNGQNTWDNGDGIGNSWGDYNGSSFYYNIPGQGGSFDAYPKAIGEGDITAPFISQPADRTVRPESQMLPIVWTVWDSNPELLRFYVNDEIYTEDRWESGRISFALEGFSPGHYNITIILTDEAGNIARDSVFIEVIVPVELYIQILSIIAAGSIVVILIMMEIRSRKQEVHSL